MDLRLLALLLFCHCRQGWTEDAVADDGKIPLVPLIPLMPSHPREDLGSSVVPPTAQAPAIAPEDPQTPSMPPAPNTGEGSSEEELDEVCGTQASGTKAKQAIGSGIMKLGLQLLENLKTDPEQPNVIISPLSVSLALSQLALGAVNETEELLLRHLHAGTRSCYHKSLSSLLQQFRKSTLQIATRLYLRPGFEAKPGFVQESQHLYDSEPVTLAGLQEVNEWVEKATNGQLTDFLTSLPPNLVLMLINAVHYKGEWLTRFDPRFTTSDLFYIDDKHTVNVDMMLGPKYPLSLLIHNELDAQVARFPFKGHMSLLVVMPMSGQVNVSAIAAKLNTSDLYSRFPRERSMQVKLPKFKLDYSQELQEVLTSMGLGELFSSPNLAGISDGPLLVSNVQHKSSMEIHEEGAEAAAATSVVISRSNPSFTVNQPFFFALMDDITQTPVFLGVISNPNPGAPTMVAGSIQQDKLAYPNNKHDKYFGRSSGHPPK